MTQTVLERIIPHVMKHVGVEASLVTPEAHIMEDLGGDSLMLVELQMDLEEEFGIELPEVDFDQLHENRGTVGDFIKIVEQGLLEEAARMQRRPAFTGPRIS